MVRVSVYICTKLSENTENGIFLHELKCHWTFRIERIYLDSVDTKMNSTHTTLLQNEKPYSFFSKPISDYRIIIIIISCGTLFSLCYYVVWTFNLFFILFYPIYAIFIKTKHLQPVLCEMRVHFYHLCKNLAVCFV